MHLTPTDYAQILDRLVEARVSFVCYFAPNDSEPTLIIEDGAPKVIDSLENLGSTRGFVFAPFNIGKDLPLLIFTSTNIIRGFSSIPLNVTGSVHAKLEAVTVKSTSRVEYDISYNRFMMMLHDGTFSKLVLSRKLAVARDGQSIGELLLKANDTYPSAFTYLVNSEEAGTWLGATPELLLRGKKGLYQTVALAGTMPTVAGCTDYQWTAKDREEQQFVSDYICERLAKCGVTDIVQVGPTTVNAGSVVHLKTTFKFRCEEDLQVGRLVDMLHPTPAVCGLPKEDALRFIVGAEPHRREYYTGFAGIVDAKGETELFVNLRCMKITPSQYVLYAGGGITAKSIGEKEWMETTHKLQTLLSIIEAEE